MFLKGWNPMHGTENPSAWLQRWAHLIPRPSRVLDVACGAGRHMRWLAAQGHTVQGVDRHPEAVALAQAYGYAGVRIDQTTQFEPALQAALAHEGGTLIEVLLDPEVITTRATMATIREAAIQRRSAGAKP